MAQGRVVPHGIYDLEENSGFVTLGTSAETPRFVAASLKRWWNFRGRFDYPEAATIYLLLDNGGANGSRSHQFKLEMLQLAAQTNRVWQISHYPSYCSKWNPIEHRFFPPCNKSDSGSLSGQRRNAPRHD